MKSLHRYTLQYAHFALFTAITLVFYGNIQAQTISYILPDIGAPDMNSYIEIIGPHDADGNFGTDGFYLNNPGDEVRVICEIPGDTSKITIGPVVVSWNGRMISTQIFVHPDVTPNSSNWSSLDPEFVVMLQVEVSGNTSNPIPFYLVNPQPAIIANGGGTIGSGGTLGTRSRRGAMIVDSMILGNGTYSVSTNDPDPIDDGNQGYLPVTILSRGPVRGTGNTTVSVNSGQLNAAPGGGGGGGAFCDVTGDGSNGGGGFTGGGRGGHNGSGVNSDFFQNPGFGSGPQLNSTGASLNGVLGGTAPWYEAASGGTGHPFGMSGEGCQDGGSCQPPPGYGGGSGQSQDIDGGAGGYATVGQSSNGINGGLVHGNMQLVPLAGGSGGAGGNPQGLFSCSGEGGAGGGAIRLYGSSLENLVLSANGGNGQIRNDASGGGGSGGAAIAEAKLRVQLNRMSALQGPGGTQGGAGRLRIDGPSAGLLREPPTATFYSGVSTDTSKFTSRMFTLTGSGSGMDVEIYLKSAQHPWHRVAVVSGYTANTWQYDITLPGTEDVYYLAAVQVVPNPGSGQYTAEPSFVMSQSGANIFRYQPIPIIAADTTLTFPVLRCSNTSLDTMYVRNEGPGTLVISDAQFVTASGFTLIEPSIPASVAPGDSVRLIIRFDPGTAGTFSTNLILTNNDTAKTRNPFTILVEGVKEDIGYTLQPPVIDLGTLACISSKDTVITLQNPYDIDIEILEPAITNGAVSLIDPPPGAYPVVIPQNGGRDIRIRINAGSVGPDSTQVIFRTGSAYCNLEARAFVSWIWDDVSYSMDDIPAFRPVYCPGELRDTSFTIRNTGSANITVELSGITNSLFSVLSPAFPVTIAPGDSIEVTVRFTGAAPGTASGSLDLLVLPCNTVEQKALSAIMYRTELTATGTNFGLQAPAQLPATQTITLTNPGTTPITVTNALFVNAIPFRVLSGIPVTIQPGGTADLVIEFFDPGFDSTFSVDMELEHTPTCGPLVVNIAGARGEASVSLEVGNVADATGMRVQIPVYLRNAVNLQLHGATAITTELRLNASILYPEFTPAGNVVNGERIIPVTIPLQTDANDIATVLVFTAMLGTVDQTAITPENSAAVGGTITITDVPGSFTLTNVCREGGDRYFDGSVTFGIAQNAPNPFNASTRISYTVIESGNVTLEVYDHLGRRVRTLVDTYAEPGSFSVIFEANDLPSGLYRAILRSPNMTDMRTMVLTK